MRNVLLLDFKFAICVWVTTQFVFLQDPKVTYSKFNESPGHPLSACPDYFLKIHKSNSQLICGLPPGL